MDTTKIFLEKMRAKQSSDTSGGVNISLNGNRKMLPVGEVSKVISYLEQYTKERDKCNKIRLTCQVNTVCSNILFNRISEIVKYEGSDHVSFLNYGIGGDTTKPETINEAFENNNQVVYKPETMEFWSGGSIGYQSVDTALSSLDPGTSLNALSNNRVSVEVNGGNNTEVDGHPTNAIRDMQLSRDDDNGDHFIYHCGLDIFNNHLIRSNTFKCINRMPEGYLASYTAFNTIADLMRESNGNKVIEKIGFPVTANVPGNSKFVALHTYLYDDILTFNDSIKQRLIEKHNGWLGFLNKSKIKTYKDFSKDEDMNIERPIMYMSGGDFVDMYPGRDLYSFVPKYNKYRNRMEKNWNYCITYPSSSTTEGFDDIIETYNNSMKTIYFDENTRADSGSMQLVMYSKAKHGLSVDDRVNIYKTYYDDGGNLVQDLVLTNARVDEIVDDFIFTTFTQSVKLSDNWVEIKPEDLVTGFTIDEGKSTERKYHISNDNGKYFYDDEFNRYFIVNDKYVNIDKNAQNITYKKVVNEIECDYYVRIFSRMPNFKFASGDTSSEYYIYNKPIQGDKVLPSLVETYQTPKYDFESHVSRLAFSKNIYTDEIGEIVFTDDIDLSKIHDNLGRPITDLYLTIVKNNAGYKEWYGFDDEDININSEKVEFSHCFGKITCGFEMSDESTGDSNTNNIKIINNVAGINVGYPSGSINDLDKRGNITDEEISFDVDCNFYGDLCYYDNFNAIERIIQPILHRFNTAQRESQRAKNGEYFSSAVYDEITNDDYDSGNYFKITSKKLNDCNVKPEGYYYIPHYKIPIKSFGKLKTIMPQPLTIKSIVNNGNTCQITTLEYHFLVQGDKSMIYNQRTDRYYYLTTIPGPNDNSRTFTCTVTDEKGNPSVDIDDTDKYDYMLYKLDNLGAPSYAHLLKDGTCRYIWRDVINNGSIGSDERLEEYPFTNGAFYVNKRVDLYLRRQDPYDKYGLYEENDIDMIGVEPPLEDINDYYNEDEIEC